MISSWYLMESTQSGAIKLIMSGSQIQLHRVIPSLILHGNNVQGLARIVLCNMEIFYGLCHWISEVRI